MMKRIVEILRSTGRVVCYGFVALGAIAVVGAITPSWDPVEPFQRAAYQSLVGAWRMVTVQSPTVDRVWLNNPRPSDDEHIHVGSANDLARAAPPQEEHVLIGSRSLEEIRRAAEEGDANAQFNLANGYRTGFLWNDVKQDYNEALRLHSLAAEQGYAPAFHAIGFMYVQGQGVPQSHREAARWIRCAADRDYPHAQVWLGRFYANGQGVPQDLVSAHMWLSLVAAHGDREQARTERDEIAVLLEPGQLAEAQRLAREWRPIGAPYGTGGPRCAALPR